MLVRRKMKMRSQSHDKNNKNDLINHKYSLSVYVKSSTIKLFISQRPSMDIGY